MELLLQNILQTLRSLRTQTWQVVVSALGLAISILCLAFSVNWLWSETNYDAFRPDYRDLYLLQKRDSLDNYDFYYKYSIREAERIAEVLQRHGDSVGIVNVSSFHILRRDPLACSDSVQHSRYFEFRHMNAAMLRTLGVEVLNGNIDESLRNMDERIIITDRVAMQLFGHTDVLGEMLYNERSKTWHPIGAVIKANAGKSHFPYDCIVNLNTTTQHYPEFDIVVRSKNPEVTRQALEGMKLDNDKPFYFSLEPLRTYAKLYGDDPRTSIKAQGGFLGVYFYQLAFVAVSLLLLLSALANLIAVNTSICLSRTREYALRSSLGGSTWQNAQWLLTGIVPTLLLSVMIAAVAEEWMVKMQWVEIDTYCVHRIFWLTVLTAVVGSLIGMLYPIVKMHRIYKRSFAGSGVMGHSHGWLVAVQCVACAFLMFLSLGISRQLHGMMNEDMGLDTHNLLRLHTGISLPEELDKEYDFKNLFRILPQEIKKHSSAGIVDAVAVRADIFNRTSYRSMLVGSQRLRDEYVRNGINPYENEHDQWLERHKDEVLEVDYVEMEYGVQQFFGVQTAKGRQMDYRISENESFAQMFGDKDFMNLAGRDAARREPLYIIARHTIGAIGSRGPQRYVDNIDHWTGKELRIVDEVNFSTTDFHKQRIPTIYVGVPDGHPCSSIEMDAVYIRYADGRLDDAEAAVRKVLRDMDVPKNQYLLTTYEEYMSKSYKEDIFYANLVTWLTVFSFLITLAGVFSTLLYTLRLQRRNMAIHRVMGAEFSDVFYGTLRPYVIYAVLGAAIAFAPAMLLMNKWMSYFTYGSTPGVGLMLCILLMMLTVITLIVLWQVNKSMNEKPIDVLRPEA